MVQQTTPEAPQSQSGSQVIDRNNFEIIDETSPEQLATEAKVLAGELVNEVPVTTDSPIETASEQPETPSAPVSPTDVPPATVAQPAAAQPQSSEQPKPPRTYSEEEWRRAQSAKDREIAQLRRQAQAVQETLRRQQLDSQVEGHLLQQEQEYGPELGEDEAKRRVRSTQNVKFVRDHYEAQAVLRQAQQEQASLNLRNEADAIVAVARHFGKQYNVPDEHMETLVYAPTPEAMERLAKRLGRATEQRLAQVPRETAQTRLEPSMSGASAPEDVNRRIERLNGTPSWEWTKDDIRFMRDGR